MLHHDRVTTSVPADGMGLHQVVLNGPTPDGSGRSNRFALVTAGHHFLLRVVPFREPESRQALEEFVQAARRIALPPPDLDAILVRCLAVLNDRTGGRLPSLVDRYVSCRPHCAGGELERFLRCVQDLLQYHGIGDGLVQQAIALIRSNYADSTFTTQTAARALGLRPSTLCVAFKRQTGLTLSQYLHTVRLDAAATLLCTTGLSIKEIWVRVGYNHPSNFAHYFKHRFQLSASEFRTRAIRPAAQERHCGVRLPDAGLDDVQLSGAGLRVLLVDDDPYASRIILENLRHEGYAVLWAPDGTSGLRALEQSSPAVILLDYHLPDMNGLTFLRRLRERASKEAPAVAVWTADWDLFGHADEVHALGSMITSKLCDLDEIRQLLLYLSSS